VLLFLSALLRTRLISLAIALKRLSSDPSFSSGCQPRPFPAVGWRAFCRRCHSQSCWLQVTCWHSPEVSLDIWEPALTSTHHCSNMATATVSWWLGSNLGAICYRNVLPCDSQILFSLQIQVPNSFLSVPLDRRRSCYTHVHWQPFCLLGGSSGCWHIFPQAGICNLPGPPQHTHPPQGFCPPGKCWPGC
jgi:hypothetical protein